MEIRDILGGLKDMGANMESLGKRVFDDPLWTTPKADWIGHIPFAFFLVEMMRPGLVVELGVFYGDSYSAMCQAAKVEGTGTRLVGIDSWEGDIHTGRYTEEVYQNLKAHHGAHYAGSSKLMRCYFDDAVGKFEDGTVDVLHIDGMHTYEAVSHDYAMWEPKVKPGGMILFHDTAVREKDEFGVWRLWEEIAPGYPERHGFGHCNGLGVVRKPGGGELPAALAGLLGEGGEKGGLDALFRRLGERIMLRWEVMQLEEKLEGRDAKIENFRGMIGRRDEKIAKLEGKMR